MNEELKSELTAKIEQFKKELDPFFPKSGGGKKGVFIVLIDDDVSEDDSILSALVMGKPSSITIGITKAMENSEEAREVLRDGVRLYEIKQNPLLKLLENIAELKK